MGLVVMLGRSWNLHAPQKTEQGHGDNMHMFLFPAATINFQTAFSDPELLWHSAYMRQGVVTQPGLQV